MSEFGGLPLVAGSARGVRAFEVDVLGRLRGVTHAQTWTPGDNEAECKRPVISREKFDEVQQMDYRLVSNGVVVNSGPSFRIEGDPHDLADPTCTCGFYAYTDAGKDHYEAKGRVTGVVEGFGATTVGTHGFRASKARLVAICVEREPEPEVAADPAPSAAQKARRTQRRLAVAGGSFALIGVAACLWTSNWLAALSAAIWVAIHVLGFKYPSAGNAERPEPEFRYAMGGHISTPRGIRIRTSVPEVDKPEVDVEKVRRNYPDVPFYTSRAEMLRDFPPDRGEELTPDNDPEFWTRSAA